MGLVVDKLFTPLYPVKGEAKKGLSNMGQVVKTVLILALQVVLGALAVFYVRKTINIIPPIINLAPAVYIHHRSVPESQGEMAVAICFIGIQANAVKELEKIRYYGSKEE